MLKANTIKAALKAAGIDTKQVSVKIRSAGYSDMIDVIVKSLDVDIRKVDDVLQQYESIDRDEYNGEILEGGNIYAYSRYEYDLLKSGVRADYMLRLIDMYELDGWTLAQLDRALVGVNGMDNSEILQRVCDIKNGKAA